ncbi:MAG TPA: pentapeptide repeat-containing protein [Ktedonobacterales bacterium]|nr:pentapeptide repeat-containing protein [Ktedonobacterales bacterium]
MDSGDIAPHASGEASGADPDEIVSRPAPDPHAARSDARARWKALGQSWRLESEIGAERQSYLAQRRAIAPNIARGVYPFGGERLTRADMEWLLATLGDGAGPIAWDDEGQRERAGLDLRGALLSGADLRGLPLAGMVGGQYGGDERQIEAAAVHLDGARLERADVRGASLHAAHLERARLDSADLRQATLTRVSLARASLREARLQKADLRDVDATEADFRRANMAECRAISGRFERARLDGAILDGANLDQARFNNAQMGGARLDGAACRQTVFTGAYLRRASFRLTLLLRASLEHAHLEEAILHGAELRAARLEGTNLFDARLDGLTLPPDEYERLARLRYREELLARPSALEPADLRGAYFDTATNLRRAALGDVKLGYPRVADLQWGGANLAVVPWSPRRSRLLQRRPAPIILGDERAARMAVTPEGKRKDRATREEELEAAVRANRQLAVALRAQGLDEEAGVYAYRAQVLQRRALLREYRAGAWLFSLFLDALAGYGYRPARSLVAYLLVILSFAAAYFTLGPGAGVHLSPLGALVFSVTSFHGRGFFPGGIPLDDPLTAVAAGEALAGLLIEISFIATFTQRFFGK